MKILSAIFLSAFIISGVLYFNGILSRNTGLLLLVGTASCWIIVNSIIKYRKNK
jgi:uncharacterized membrane protein